MQQNVVTNNRIKWIDGIKGLCCIGIFCHHFLLKYAPESFSGMSETGHNTMACYLSDTVFGVVVNGNFFVFIFIILSGFVVSIRIMGRPHEPLGKFLVNRYLKLSIPILMVELLYYLFYNLQIGGTVLSDTDGVDSLSKVIDNAMIKVLLYGDTTFAGAFWMMPVIFVGGVMLTVLATITWDNKKNGTILLAFFGIVLLLKKECNYSGTP